jgi:hypothetical protein
MIYISSLGLLDIKKIAEELKMASKHKKSSKLTQFLSSKAHAH